MPKVVIPSDLQRYTGGKSAVEVSALNYREIVTELCARFPALTGDVVRKQAVAIDGVITPMPLLASFRSDSELVLFAKIAGG